MSDAAAFYVGSVLHRRLRPKRHKLKHACYWMFFDIARIGEFASTLRLFSHNRFNVLSYHDTDHGDGSSTPLRNQLQALMQRQGITPPEGAYRLLCMPRVLGYGFNPLSVFFCHDESDRLRVVIYEVHNTFHERHHYVFELSNTNSEVLRHSCDKDFYVSPFMDIEMSYDFKLSPPGERTSVAIHTLDRDGPMLFALLKGERRPFSDSELLRLAFSQPLVTMKVVAAIHIHAAILWWKGVRVRRWKAGLRRADRPVGLPAE